ncbi:MAG: hypothetical protein KDA58_13725, partial [Planctomycetaceae bacterium]|nr:hypothetical protein [Planctomycetaceae bacterium]
WVLALLALVLVPLMMVGTANMVRVESEHQMAVAAQERDALAAQRAFAEAHAEQVERAFNGDAGTIPVDGAPSESPSVPESAVPLPETMLIEEGVDSEPPKPVTDQPESIVEVQYRQRQDRLLVLAENARSEIPLWAVGVTGTSSKAIKDTNGVIRSKRYATVDEARAELYGRMLPKLKATLHGAYPHIDRHEPDIHSFLASGLLTHELRSTYSVQINEFSTPVYEVTWQYNLTDPVGLKFLDSRWRALESGNRITLIAIIFAALTGAFAVLSGALYRAGQTPVTNSPEPVR